MVLLDLAYRVRTRVEYERPARRWPFSSAVDGQAISRSVQLDETLDHPDQADVRKSLHMPLQRCSPTLYARVPRIIIILTCENLPRLASIFFSTAPYYLSLKVKTHVYSPIRPCFHARIAYAIFLLGAVSPRPLDNAQHPTDLAAVWAHILASLASPAAQLLPTHRSYETSMYP